MNPTTDPNCAHCRYFTAELNRQQALIRTLTKRVRLLRNLAGLPNHH